MATSIAFDLIPTLVEQFAAEVPAGETPEAAAARHGTESLTIRCPRKCRATRPAPGAVSAGRDAISRAPVPGPTVSAGWDDVTGDPLATALPIRWLPSTHPQR